MALSVSSDQERAPPSPCTGSRMIAAVVGTNRSLDRVQVIELEVDEARQRRAGKPSR